MNSGDLNKLKAACPMPTLLYKLGLGHCAKSSCCSPFREDKSPSWGIFKRSGQWFFKDQGTGDSGDEITLLARWKRMDEKRDFQPLLRLYAELAGVSSNGEDRQQPTTKANQLFAWSTCVATFTDDEIEKLTAWRAYSCEFCTWLKKENLIGLHEGNWALPVHGECGAVLACHYRVEPGNGQRPVWYYHPKGIGVRALVFGEPKRASNGFVFESPWDAFAVMDKLGWHRPKGIPDTSIVITRGAGNGKLVAGLFTPQTTVYAFKQNDETKNGKNPADEWLADVCAHAGCKVYHIATPAPHKDLNDWTRAGATPADIMAAIQDARPVSEVKDSSGVYDTGGKVEIVEKPASEDLTSGSFPTLSTFSPGGISLDQAIYPDGSLLARYMDFARLREESADSYLLGSVLAVLAASLARRVSFPWGEGRIYPNLFVMLAGKPGDRKSSAINLAEKVARIALEKKCFLPDSLSPEALFDEYDEERDGCPDKLLIADDANPFLGLIQKSNYGERVGELLLRLFDCKGLAESFRRNKSGESTGPRRFIPETSTSIVFGATFNVCQFQGHEIRSGLQRRFNYYLAEKHGRFIAVPAKSDQMQLLAVTERLAKLVSLTNTECQFAPDAAQLWEHFQRENRRQLEGTAINQESQLARLNGQPAHVLKLAMIFQSALWAESSVPFAGLIELATLQMSIRHSHHSVAAAQVLDAIGNRAVIQADADVLLAKIENEFGDKNREGVIVLTRTDLTSAYAHHSGRNGALKPDDLYLRLIPDLIRRGKAKEIPRPGKPSAFAFRVEESNTVESA